MTTWGALRDNIRASLLKDTGTSEKWSDAQLMLFFNWALDEFCLHTAKAVVDTYSSSRLKPDAVTYYNLPTDTEYTLAHTPFDMFAYTSLVTAVKSDVPTPIRPLVAPHPTLYGYYLTGSNVVKVNPAPASDSLFITYYAQWAHVALDADVLEIPSWAESIVSLRTALHCYTYQAGRNAMVRQWDEKGNREQNPVREHQQWLENTYYNILSQYPRQNRRQVYVAYE